MERDKVFKTVSFFQFVCSTKNIHASKHRLMIPDQSERRPHQRYIFYQRNTSPYQYKIKDVEHLCMGIEEVKSMCSSISMVKKCLTVTKLILLNILVYGIWTLDTFNWSMTFRIDSDLPVPYGWIDPIDMPRRDRPVSTREMPYKWLPYNNSEIIRSYRNQNASLIKLAAKTKTVAWLCSHQNAFSRRDQYVKELQKYINVDIYGRFDLFCGNKR